MNIENWKPTCKNSPYQEYGKVFKITWFQFIIFICLITPATNWLIPFCQKLSKYELMRITLNNEVRR
jgi:hypothetical protein